MVGLRLAGVLWTIAGLVCVLLFLFVFVGENVDDLGVLLQNPVLPSLVVAGAVVGLMTGVRLIAMPGPKAVRWSNVAGTGWLVTFGSLFLTRLDEPGPRTSSGLIAAFGIAGALVAFAFRNTRSPR